MSLLLSGQCLSKIKQIAETEAEAGVRFRIMETGGRTIKSLVQRSNPTGTSGCQEPDCLPCITGKGSGGNCRACGVNYQVECQLCPLGRKGLYHGETEGNLYTRGKEHEAKYKSKNIKSFMLKHQAREHGNNTESYVA